MTKGEINRLGTRLIATSTPAQADLQQLAAVLEVYQAVLERVKEDLRGLGFSPTGRVKTTSTMTDKLRRTRGMELARVQDLAGARFVVDDLEAQDEARAKITEFYMDLGCPVRVTDRRTDPRFGYRAVHVIVTIEAMPVEIQIRTELQDSWRRSSSDWLTVGVAGSGMESRRMSLRGVSARAWTRYRPARRPLPR